MFRVAGRAATYRGWCPSTCAGSTRWSRRPRYQRTGGGTRGATGPILPWRHRHGSAPYGRSEVNDLGKRIEGRDTGRAERRNDERRHPTGCDVGFDRRTQRRNVHVTAHRVDRHRSNVRGGVAGEEGRLPHRRVRFSRRVDVKALSETEDAIIGLGVVGCSLPRGRRRRGSRSTPCPE